MWHAGSSDQDPVRPTELPCCSPVVWNLLPTHLRSTSVSREHPSLHTGLRIPLRTFCLRVYTTLTLIYGNIGAEQDAIILTDTQSPQHLNTTFYNATNGHRLYKTPSNPLPCPRHYLKALPFIYFAVCHNLENTTKLTHLALQAKRLVYFVDLYQWCVSYLMQNRWKNFHFCNIPSTAHTISSVPANDAIRKLRLTSLCDNTCHLRQIQSKHTILTTHTHHFKGIFQVNQHLADYSLICILHLFSACTLPIS